MLLFTTSIRKSKFQDSLDWQWKPDGVGPLDIRTSNNKLHYFVRKRKWKRDMRHMTCDMWHLTCDTWHLTCDMLWGVNILSKCQFPSTYSLWFMIFWSFLGKAWLTKSMNQSISDKGVCRKALATPGLLIIQSKAGEGVGAGMIKGYIL